MLRLRRRRRFAGTDSGTMSGLLVCMVRLVISLARVVILMDQLFYRCNGSVWLLMLNFYVETRRLFWQRRPLTFGALPIRNALPSSRSDYCARLFWRQVTDLILPPGQIVKAKLFFEEDTDGFFVRYNYRLRALALIAPLLASGLEGVHFDIAGFFDEHIYSR